MLKFGMHSLVNPYFLLPSEFKFSLGSAFSCCEISKLFMMLKIVEMKNAIEMVNTFSI